MEKSKLTPIIEDKETSPGDGSYIAKKAPSLTHSDSEAKNKWLDEEVLVEFMSLETPPHSTRFSKHDKKGTGTRYYFLEHGNRYKLTRRLIQNLEDCRYAEKEYKPDGTGILRQQTVGYESRFQFRQVFE